MARYSYISRLLLRVSAVVKSFVLERSEQRLHQRLDFNRSGLRKILSWNPKASIQCVYPMQSGPFDYIAERNAKVVPDCIDLA